MDSTTAQAVGLLDDAARILFERGWHQGDYRGPGGELCVTAALREASKELLKETTGPGTVEVERIDSLALHALDEEAQELGCGLEGTLINNAAGYNDIVARTLDDIRVLIKAAQARLQRAEEPQP